MRERVHAAFRALRTSRISSRRACGALHPDIGFLVSDISNPLYSQIALGGRAHTQ